MTRSVLNSASFADNSVTTAKIANNAVATTKIADNAVTKNKSAIADYLKPVWVNFQYNAGGNSNHRFVSSYGKKIYSNNGNNGPAVMAMLDGSTGTGEFMVEWIPGYYWGWSGLYFTDRAALSTESNGDFSPNWMVYSPTGYKQFAPQNNSSNNKRYISYWDGSASTTPLNTTGGTNGATWYCWRDSTGHVRISDSVSTTTIIASGDTTDYIVSSATGQSVSSCEIISARRQS